MLVEFNFELLLGAFLFLLVLAVMMLGLAHRHAHAWQNWTVRASGTVY